MPRELPADELDAITQLLFANRTIEAIKRYRQATGSDLKQARDTVYELRERLLQESPERFGPMPAGQGHGLWLIVGLVAVGMAIWWLVEWIGAPRAN
jgi:hypothetical protein